MGKSEEICRVSWISNFVYDRHSYIFVKNCGGHEAVQQLKDAITRWNLRKINPILKELGVSQLDWRRYHIVPKDKLEPDSTDRQVILKLTNHSSIDIAIREISQNQKSHQEPTIVLDESDLAVQTESKDEHKTEKAMCRLYPLAFQRVMVTATMFANAWTEQDAGRVTCLPIKPALGGDQSLAYHGISRRVPQTRRPVHRGVRPDSAQSALPLTADYVDKAIEMPSDADVDPKVVLEVVLHSE